MERLPRGTCPVCERNVAVRRDGLVREHRVYRSQLEQDGTPRLGRSLSATRLCAGSGRVAKEVRG
jgi:hypothetical protein